MDIVINNNLKDKINKPIIKKIIFVNYLIFYILMFIFLVSAFLVLKSNLFLTILFFILAFISLLLALRILFFKNKEKIIQSKLVKEYLKKNHFSQEEIIKIKFKYDPIYHDRIVLINKISEDEKYFSKVNELQNKYNSLVKMKNDLITNIKENRWTNVIEDKFAYNLIEGKVKINNNIYKFNQIKKCTIDSDFSDEYVVSEEYSNNNNLYFFNEGDIDKAFLYTRRRKNVSRTTKLVNLCDYLSICVSLTDSEEEIILIDKSMDKQTNEYKELCQTARSIIKDLKNFSKIKEERKYVEVEQELVVLKYKQLVENAKNELAAAILDKPKYQIDPKYLF